MNPEARITKNIVNFIENIGGYAIKNHGSQYSRIGTPDIIACYNGRFIAIEVKNKANKPTATQNLHLHLAEIAGAVAFVATSVEDVEKKLSNIKS